MYRDAQLRKAINPSGATITGVVAADTADLAVEITSTSQGYIPMEIADESASEKDSLIARLPVARFRQGPGPHHLHEAVPTMFNAGLPFSRSCRSWSTETEN